MPQLGRLYKYAQDDSGNATSGVSLNIYREGAYVNNDQSGTTPLTVNVFHNGKIKAGDTVFVGSASSTTYTVNSVTSTTVVLSGFSGTLSLFDGDRLVPSNSQPTLYSDDQGSGSTTNPLTSSSTGLWSAWLEFGEYDLLQSGGGLTTTLHPGIVIGSESPGQIRYADDFAVNSSTGGIQEALNDLPSSGGVVKLSATTYTVAAKITCPSSTTIEGSGIGNSIVKLGTAANVILLENSDTTNGNNHITLLNITFDGNNSAQSSNTNSLIHMKRVSQFTMRGCELQNCRADALYMDPATAAKASIIESNFIHDVMTNVAAEGHAAIYINTTSAAQTQTIIRGNIMENIATATGTTGISMPAIATTNSSLSEIVISDNSLFNCQGQAIYCSAGNRVVITGNIVRKFGQQNVANGGNGIFVTGANKVVCNNNITDTCPANSDNGIEITSSTDVVCDGNFATGIANTAKAGIGFSETLRLSCTGNTSTANSGGGIYLKGATGTAVMRALFAGNLCTNNTGGHGIDVRGYGNIAITGNVCRTNGFAGIDFAEGTTVSGAEATDCTINGNVCTGNTLEGISVLGEVVAATGQLARRLTIVGNSCNGNTGDGMRLWDISGAAVIGNVVSTNGGDGIELGGAAITDVTVDGNIIRDNTSIGLKNGASATTRLLVGQSNIIQNNGTVASAAIGTPTLSGATPAVQGVSTAIVTNGGATTVTNLTGGFDGQILRLQHTDANTTYTDGTNIFLAGSANYNPTATSCLTLMQVASKWYELGRSAN